MTSKVLLPFCNKAYRNFKRQRKKENRYACSSSQNLGHFRRARPVFTVEREQQADAKRNEKIERCGHNDPSFPDHPVRMIYCLRQAPMIDVASTQAQAR
jgi:hypothetical protein